MAVNSFVENVNKLAISLYGVDVSIITNNIDAITFLYNYISNGGEFGTIGASTVIENVSILPNASTEGTIVYLNTNNKLYVYNGASWDEVGGSVIESTGGSITVVNSKPASATLGDIIYLTTDGFLYTWDGTTWDKVGGISTTGDGGIFVDERPSTPNIGDTVLNIIDGSVSTWDGTQWVVEEYTPHASSMTAIKFVTALPLAADAKNGDLVYNETDGITYIFKNGAWVNLLEDLTPNASGTGIEIVTELPLTVTDGKVLYNSADKKLYEGVNGSWVPVVEATTAATDVADASITVAKFAAGIKPVEIVGALPTTGNSVGRVVYLTTDGQLYRYTASGFTTAVPAQALTGTITATQIANDAITTPKIATGAITADEIGANAITAGKIAIGAVTAGTIQAGAISATEIASNAITTDKIYSGAITAIKLSANSVDATKIVAGSITASLIAADAINAGHIQAGAIGASEISAGAITADKIASRSITSTIIQAGAITSTEIASNAITADKILAGSITANKLSSGTTNISGGAFSLGEGANVNGRGAIGCFNSSTDKFGIIGACSGGQCGVVAASSSTNYASAHFNLSSPYSGARTSVYIANSSHAGAFVNDQSAKRCYLSTMSYALEMNGGGFASMTGCHDGLILKTDAMPVSGDIVVDDRIYAKPNVYDSICVNKISTIVKQKNVVGVMAEKTDINHIPTSLRDINGVLNHSYTDFNLYTCIAINAIGEGLMNVCGLGGNIEAGDLITTSSIAGKGMKQDDDLIHNYTVAKARESVTFSSPTEIKMIACTYHCG